MISGKTVRVVVGGETVPGTNIRDTSPYVFIFTVWKYSDEKFSFIDLSSAVDIRNLIRAYYSKVGQIGRTFVDISTDPEFAEINVDPVQGAKDRLIYARYWGNKILTQFADFEVLFAGKLIANIDQRVKTVVTIDFNLQVRWRDLLNVPPLSGKAPLNTHWVGAFPSYMDSEGTGFILLDRDNNLDGPIQNVNLTLREDENYVRSQVEFTNIPLFSRTLFVRPKLKKAKLESEKCRKNKHRHNHKHSHSHSHSHSRNHKQKHDKPRVALSTSTDMLEYMVNYIYQNAKAVLDENIDPLVGEKNILEIVDSYDKYRTSGTNLIFSYINDEDGVFINFCGRYNLESETDCIVAFNMCTGNRDLILKVSNAPVDEDMRDVIYPFIIPFGYKLN